MPSHPSGEVTRLRSGKGGGWNPRPVSLARIEAARAVIDEAAADGVRLTLRAVFYRLVGQNNRIANSKREYDNLSHTLDRARWEGLLDPDALVDWSGLRPYGRRGRVRATSWPT
ncbi:MAG: hypothetical protein OXI71_11590 [Gemmatimonadota bacterium]|nr:hypothetical protein [Gemmatimonadota bacterium]